MTPKQQEPLINRTIKTAIKQHEPNVCNSGQASLCNETTHENPTIIAN